MIALVKTGDAAPLPHLRHLSAEQRRVTAEIGGTPRGIALAAEVREWARNELARADAIDAQAQMIAQTRGTADLAYTDFKAQADKFRKRAQALEEEATALMTTHEPQPALTGDAAWERHRSRIQHRHKGV
jgi:hypothetical protein